MNTLLIVTGIICIVISLFIFIPAIKKANTAKEKWGEILEFVLDPFTGLTGVFYLGLLLIFFGLVRMFELI
ncbi:hypothetical protein L2D08_20285 [Domibacillus sp. PGB-M46]|uniref:hypothetical protein n=1 Tax=Domibacillus sp. PGB-M46 TaxID=2910255 RepID=UPI001F59EE3D|nr:hypothetical protein [Domibacillus sp. PGB-M46]MCI2256674.1 hypothetical protein [Domibacillus sp. PGB-M46]